MVTEQVNSLGTVSIVTPTDLRRATPPPCTLSAVCILSTYSDEPHREEDSTSEG